MYCPWVLRMSRCSWGEGQQEKWNWELEDKKASQSACSGWTRAREVLSRKNKQQAWNVLKSGGKAIHSSGQGANPAVLSAWLSGCCLHSCTLCTKILQLKQTVPKNRESIFVLLGVSVLTLKKCPLDGCCHPGLCLTVPPLPSPHWLFWGSVLLICPQMVAAGTSPDSASLRPTLHGLWSSCLHTKV